MSKIDEFKEFVKNKPELAKAVVDNKVTWQKLFETYDIYGTNSSVWKDLLKKESENSINVKNILNSLSNIDSESFEKNISSIQKAIGFFEELTRSDKNKKDKKVKKSNEYKTFDSFYSD